VYAAVVARGLGRRVGVVTAAPEDVVRAGLPEDVQVVRYPAETATSFENVYRDGARVQRLPSAGAPIPADLLPDAWLDAAVTLLGPVYHEVDAALAARPRGLVGVCAQGFLRRADADGLIRPLPAASWDAAPLLRHARALFLSEEDIGPDAGAALAAWAAIVPVLAVTDGARGARIHADGAWRHIPAYPAREVDPTGAGDAYAAGFLIALDEGADPWQAGRFAAAVSALMVEVAGAAAVSRAAVEERMRLVPLS
jgi:hypothetical protein